MRFFIALEIPQECRQEIENVQKEVQQLFPNVRLTDPRKLHLTIAFVGDQDESIKEDLIQVMNKSAEGIPAFKVTPAYIDGFPNLHDARVLWIGVKGDIDKLMIIRERVKDGLAQMKVVVDERRYTPHITLAKISTNFDLTPEKEAHFQSLVTQQFSDIPIVAIKLFESIPDESFHIHNTLAEIKLG